MKEDIKKAMVTEWYEDGKTNEYAVRYDANKTMLQNARKILREIKNNDYFKTLKLSSTQPEIEDWSDDDSVEFSTEFVFNAYSSKGYDISVEIRFCK